MKILDFREEIELPEGIVAVKDGNMLTVKTEKNEIQKKFVSPILDLKVENNKIVLTTNKLTKKEKALVGTFRAHVNNMIKGLLEGHHYKLKICSGHFPMNVSYNNNVLSIKNFIGEKIPRTLTVNEKVNLKLDGDFITIESVDKELAGQTAGSIEKLTKRTKFDKRIFQDGIYIVEKNDKKIE
ncbi:MAG: 50S ribosomal protein L6 [Minisyncoccales bacterium]